VSSLRILPAVAALLLVSSWSTACSGGDEPTSEPSSPAPTPLSELATDTLTVARADFCSRVAPAEIEEALGDAAEAADDWANGDRAELASGVTDVAHEYGCRWTAADGTTAQGWVFAPPVTRGHADELRRAAVAGDGCRPVTDAPRFGSRTIAVRCQDGTTAFHGLFGDAWLSCSLRVPGRPAAADAVDRADRWCVAVAQAAASSG
jgi:hypothetical protein